MSLFFQSPGWILLRLVSTSGRAHPAGTAGLVDSISRTVDLDGHGHIRHLTQAAVPMILKAQPGQVVRA
jgi:hypothetical protein